MKWQYTVETLLMPLLPPSKRLLPWIEINIDCVGSLRKKSLDVLMGRDTCNYVSH